MGRGCAGSVCGCGRDVYSPNLLCTSPFPFPFPLLTLLPLPLPCQEAFALPDVHPVYPVFASFAGQDAREGLARPFRKDLLSHIAPKGHHPAEWCFIDDTAMSPGNS